MIGVVDTLTCPQESIWWMIWTNDLLYNSLICWKSEFVTSCFLVHAWFSHPLGLYCGHFDCGSDQNWYDWSSWLGNEWFWIWCDTQPANFYLYLHVAVFGDVFWIELPSIYDVNTVLINMCTLIYFVSYSKIVNICELMITYSLNLFINLFDFTFSEPINKNKSPT